MDFFVSLDGSKAGPFSIFKVGELLAQGKVTPETLAWHRGLEAWRPIREIPALDAVREHHAEEPPGPESVLPPPLPQARFAPGAPVEPPRPGVSPRPFVRFWARMFDYTLVSVLVFQFSDFVMPQPVAGEAFAETLQRYLEEMRKPEAFVLARTLFLALIGWHALEAVMIHLLGTTPGKSLFGLRVKTLEGDRVPLLPSLGRSFYVYVLGVGFYQFPFILIGMIFSFIRLLTTGQCLWDQHLRTRVEHPPLGALRIVLAICAFFALLLLQSVRFE